MIEIKNLNKSYGDIKIFEDLNLKIDDNTMIAIVGASGCGKSTLLNIIGLIDNDYTGEVYYDDNLVSKLNERKKIRFIRDNINYLFQNYALIDNETVKYNLMLALEYEKISKKEKEEKIMDILEKFNMTETYNKKVYTLSGGEQQRISLARTILKKGNVILADEPTGNLDEENSVIIMNFLKELKNKIRIVVTHDMNVARQCDKIIDLNNLKK